MKRNRSLIQFFLLGVFLNITVKSISQEPYQASKIIPPSPTAASLGVYGDLNVSYYTGLPDINIHLYEIKTANHTLPITMRYNASGIRVSENAGWVGLSWSLSAGGVITRTIRGGDDFGNNGYYIAQPLPQETNPLRLEDKDYFDKIVDNQIDAEPDIISYNFGNFSGKFVLGKRSDGSKVYLADKNNFQIEFIPAEHTWIVTTGEGYKYYFGQQEGGTDYYYSNSGEIDINTPLNLYSRDFKPDPITAWYLDRIVSPSGELITLEYQIKSTSLSLVNQSQSEYDLFSSTGGCASSPGFNATYRLFSASRQEIKDLYLTKINFSQGTIEFNTTDRDDIEYRYEAKPKKLSEIIIKDVLGNVIKKFSFGYNYFNSGSFDKRLKLENITESGSDGSSKPPYVFTYFDPENLPPKYTKDIDHWGFYNAKGNNSLLPEDILETGSYTRNLPGGDRTPLGSDAIAKKGVLQTITYPTGGSTNFDYETHTYRNPTGDDRYIKTLKQVNVISDPWHSYGYHSASFDINSKTNVNFSFNFLRVVEGNEESIEGVRTEYAYVYKTGVTTPIYAFSNFYCNGGEDISCATSTTADRSFSTVLSPGNYRIEVSYRYPYQFTMHAAWTDKELVNQRKGGGLRVKSIKNSVAGSTTNIRRFIYEENNLSTGILLSQPVYTFNIAVASGAINDCYHYAEYLGRMSSSINGNGLSSSNSLVGYDKVIELLGENGEGGKTEHFFYNEEEISSPRPFLPGISNPLNGKEAVTFIKDAAGKGFKKVDYNYETKSSNYLKGVKIYQPPISSNPSTNSYDVYYYNNTSYWSVLSSKIETLFTDAGSLASTTKYFYSNPEHMEVTSQEFTNSDGKTQIKTFKYPGDYASAGTTSFVAQMKLRHIITPIIEEQTLVKQGSLTKLIAGAFTEYKLFNNSFYKPYITYKINTSAPLFDLTASDISSSNAITLHPSSRPEMYFDDYDLLGNIKTLHKANDLSKSYLWGYNGTYPVAEVIGANASTISGLVNQSVLDDVNSTESQKKGQLANLRSSLLSTQAHVTTYTYKPLVGITSETDINGRTTYYEYDTFGRLQVIKDKDGKILKTFDYKYKQTP